MGKEKTTGKKLDTRSNFLVLYDGGAQSLFFHDKSTTTAWTRGDSTNGVMNFSLTLLITNYRCLLIYLRKNHWVGSEFRQSKGGMKGITRAARAEESSIRYNAIQAINF